MSQTKIEEKLPEVTASFWLLTLVTLTLAATGGDNLFMRVNFNYLLLTRVFYGVAIFIFALQWITRRNYSILYWLTVLAMGIAGPMIFDLMDSSLWISHELEMVILGGGIVALVLAMRLISGNFRVSQLTRKAEGAFWAAMALANILGAALTIYVTEHFDFGLFGAFLMVAGGLMITAGLACSSWVNRTLLFWIALILIRPVGTGLGDLLTKTQEQGGLNLDRLQVTAALLGVFFFSVLLVSISWKTKKKKPQEQAYEPLTV